MNSFELVKDLYFVRQGGTKEEEKASNIIKDKVLSLGIKDVVIENFDVDAYEIKKASLIIDGKEFSCAGVGLSGSTKEEGISGKLVYVEDLCSARVLDLKDKICLVHSKLLKANFYEYLINHQVKGIILSTGSVYKDVSEVDLDPYMYRERNYKFGKIPAVCIRMKDLEEIINNENKEATITVIQDEFKRPSRNVVATIKGKTDEVVCFSAHYDSVAFSKGAYDNATGSAAILELLSYFSKKEPLRTLKFIWCGSEEMGLLGSKAYCNMHKEELKDYVLNINIDMLGVSIGYDIACVTAEKDLVNYINYMGKIKGFAINARQGVYSSDSTPFADNGVPAISFARISPTGGATIHSHDDVIDHLNENVYLKSCNFISLFADTMVNSVAFPVTKVIPDNMKLELDYYNGRKERE